MKSDDNMQFMLDIMSSHHQIIQQNSKNTHFEHFWEFSKNIFFEDLRNRTKILVDCYFSPGFVVFRTSSDRTEIFMKKYGKTKKLEHFL